MSEIIRHCPDCGRGSLFAQHHELAGYCPDSADECCPEWYCVACGATLLIGDIPAVLEAAGSPALHDRVA
jgi:ribosomal protein S27AE